MVACSKLPSSTPREATYRRVTNAYTLAWARSKKISESRSHGQVVRCSGWTQLQPTRSLPFASHRGKGKFYETALWTWLRSRTLHSRRRVDRVGTRSKRDKSSN